MQLINQPSRFGLGRLAVDMQKLLAEPRGSSPRLMVFETNLDALSLSNVCRDLTPAPRGSKSPTGALEETCTQIQVHLPRPLAVSPMFRQGWSDEGWSSRCHFKGTIQSPCRGLEGFSS
jgi:hypothetical protein